MRSERLDLSAGADERTKRFVALASHDVSAGARGSRTPVCILGTLSDEDDIQPAMARCARAYMVKPPTLQQLELALKGVHTLDLQPSGDALILCAEHVRTTSSATA
jgi:DNA-binding NarL/FixJ family response regulator